MKLCPATTASKAIGRIERNFNSRWYMDCESLSYDGAALATGICPVFMASAPEVEYRLNRRDRHARIIKADGISAAFFLGIGTGRKTTNVTVTDETGLSLLYGFVAYGKPTCQRKGSASALLPYATTPYT